MITITEMKVGEFPVPVPVGLSELLNGCWIKEKKHTATDNGYDRLVVCKDGQLITKLVKRKN
ncbi:hypothetical protein J1P26_17415 [Neobacillus sp. MM2021_6]|uniref:hypothetical protein n=1 Tax=Bacillaceae TaxID=186817 RepID=UPI00140D9DBD|nr:MULTISPECIES: hypothetical protein [Bacillaceae]MBO0961488.1 hypothetical protein [Neobacillus sp. MM2021_6]NHC19592.1 hypothetical protein [Bacillus sp. MM2020_4]